MSAGLHIQPTAPKHNRTVKHKDDESISKTRWPHRAAASEPSAKGRKRLPDAFPGVFRVESRDEKRSVLIRLLFHGPPATHSSPHRETHRHIFFSLLLSISPTAPPPYIYVIFLPLLHHVVVALFPAVSALAPGVPFTLLLAANCACCACTSNIRSDTCQSPW